MEQLKQELYEYIDKYGLQDDRTIAKSVELDVEVVRVMNEED